MSVATKVSGIADRNKAGQLFFRVRKSDHVELLGLLAARQLRAHGLILDPRYAKVQQPLLAEASKQGIRNFLDTQAMELALPQGITQGHRALPWGGKRPHKPEDFEQPPRRQKFINHVVEFAVSGGYSDLIAPAHYVPDLESPWIAIDLALAQLLRESLDRAGARNVRITFPITVHGRVLYDHIQREALLKELAGLPVQAYSLRVQPFRNTSGPKVIRDFVEACQALRVLKRPVLIERAGGAGLALYALGAVDAVESGINTGESFDILDRLRPKPENEGKAGFTQRDRVYLGSIGLSLTKELTEKLLESPHAKSKFGCPLDCCKNGPADMWGNPYRHFIVSRQTEFQNLASLPSAARGDHYVNQVVSVQCDMLSRAMQIATQFDEKLTKRMQRTQARLVSVKEMIGSLLAERALAPHSGAALAPQQSVGGPAQVLQFPVRDPIQ